MKTLFNTLAFATALIITNSSCTISKTTAQPPPVYADRYQDDYQDDDVNFSTFYSELSPYGRWIDYPTYGKVWIVNEVDFRPYYSRGHWIYTNYGWTWASDYSWGWAPFHYGRWAYDNALGWFWVPGYNWAPAWVGWRSGAGCYGWAPLAPGINISVGVSWGNNIPYERWCFLPNRYMGYSNINNFYVDRRNVVNIYNNTTIINNTNVYRNSRYITGPEKREVERYSNRNIETYQVNNVRRFGQIDSYGRSDGRSNDGVNRYNPNAQSNRDNDNTRRNSFDERRNNHDGWSSSPNNNDNRNRDDNRIDNRNNNPSAPNNNDAIRSRRYGDEDSRNGNATTAPPSQRNTNPQTPQQPQRREMSGNDNNRRSTNQPMYVPQPRGIERPPTRVIIPNRPSDNNRRDDGKDDNKRKHNG